MLRVTVAALCLVGAAPVNAQSMRTGNDMLRTCTSTSGVDAVTCLSFIQGVVDTSMIGPSMYGQEIYFCVPSGSTIGQYNDVIIAYLRNHPERRHYASASLIIEAMRQAFPCNR
jgi:hypothetical protein